MKNEEENPKNNNRLIDACAERQFALVKAVIENPNFTADPKIVCRGEANLLHIALGCNIHNNRRGRDLIKICKYLVKCGVEPGQLFTNPFTNLVIPTGHAGHLAVYGGYITVVNHLLKHDFSLIATPNSDGQTMIDIAKDQGSNELIKPILCRALIKAVEQLRKVLSDTLFSHENIERELVAYCYDIEFLTLKEKNRYLR